jgi:transcriptional regulator with XRE-family HTH domain
MGRELRAWREGGGIKQQDLAAQGCVSATVVRNIEKGSYESAPHPSLVSAVGRLGGPARELRELAAAYRTLQGKQRRVDRLLSRKEVPESAGWLDGEGEQPGLRPAVSSRPPSLFVGRRDELTALARALASQRLITVVGPGGIGKTALCVRFAGSLPRPLAGPWFTDLSRVEAGKPVLPVLADLILDDAGDTGDNAEVVARLGAVLADTPALIILDNCEHVLAAAATAVMRILTACPGVRFLATSREPLHLPDEWVMTVGPLPVANRDGLGGWPASEPGDAVELFVRLLGQARGEESELSSAEVAEVAELCRTHAAGT